MNHCIIEQKYMDVQRWKSWPSRLFLLYRCRLAPWQHWSCFSASPLKIASLFFLSVSLSLSLSILYQRVPVLNDLIWTENSTWWRIYMRRKMRTKPSLDKRRARHARYRATCSTCRAIPINMLPRSQKTIDILLAYPLSCH